MRDALGVHIVHTAQDVLHADGALVLFEAVLIDDAVEQLAALGELRDPVHAAVVLEGDITPTFLRSRHIAHKHPVSNCRSME